mgnify:CR=1 FL=1
MRQTIALLFLLTGISTFSFGQDSKKADSTLVKSKSSELKNSNSKTSSSGTIIEGESKASDIVRPEPVIIYRDEEKTIVKPN